MIALQEQIDRSSRLLYSTNRDILYRRPSATPPVPRTGGLTTHLASELIDIESALHLVYKAYIDTGLIDPNPFQMRVTKYHMLETSNVFIAEENDDLVGTLTLVRDGEFGLPMEDIYGDEIAARRARGISMAEVSCLADAGHGQRSMLNVVVQLMSHMAQFALQNSVRELVIAVHPHHVGFYERFAGFEQIGEQRSYSAVCDHPAIALAVDLTTIHIKNPRVHQRFFGNPFPAAELTAPELSADTLEQLGDILDLTSKGCHHARRLLPVAA